MALFHRGTLGQFGVEMIGANAKAIERGEDRQVFKDLMLSIGLDVPVSGTAHTPEEARQVAEKIGRFRSSFARPSPSAAPAAALPTTARNSTKWPSMASNSPPCPRSSSRNP